MFSGPPEERTTGAVAVVEEEGGEIGGPTTKVGTTEIKTRTRIIVRPGPDTTTTSIPGNVFLGTQNMLTHFV